MGLKTFIVTQDTLAISKHCRLDQKYSSFTSVDKWIVFDSEYEQQELSKLLKVLPVVKLKKGQLDAEYLLINISDQVQRSGQLDDIQTTDYIGSDKTYLKDADIIVSKLGMPRGYIYLNDYKGKNIIGSTELLPYAIVNNSLKIFIKYLLLHPKSLKAYSFVESGKTPSHRRVNPYEFLKIKFPIVPKGVQEKAIKEILSVEEKISKYSSQLVPHEDIINSVFNELFDFDIETFNDHKSVKTHDLDFTFFSNNRDLRNSVKFHRKAGQFVLSELSKHTRKKIKDYISESIVLGKGISPSQYDDDGSCYYLSMATIKNWKVNHEDARKVSDQFFSDNLKKTIRKNDILLARSGEGTIGKVAIVEDDDLQGVFADFTMRIRFEGYDPLFAYYYFRTTYFQYLVEINKKGLGNNTNIFPSQIQELPLLDISIKQQGEIVSEVKKKLDHQEDLIRLIDKERGRIDIIIEDALSGR